MFVCEVRTKSSSAVVKILLGLCIVRMEKFVVLAGIDNAMILAVARVAPRMVSKDVARA